MSSREIHILPDKDALLRATAERIVNHARRAAERNGRVTLALSGGSTPGPLYALLADEREPYRGRMPWAQLHLLWVDDRFVPPADERSNYRLVRETLLSKVSLPETQVHRMKTELASADETASDYQRELERVLNPGGDTTGKPPVIDIALLGLGADGHTASLFPGVELSQDRKRWVQGLWIPEAKMHRVTLLPQLLRQVELLIMLVEGAGKSGIVAKVLAAGAEEKQAFPANRVAPERGAMAWMLDRAAAARLPSEDAA